MRIIDCERQEFEEKMAEMKAIVDMEKGVAVEWKERFNSEVKEHSNTRSMMNS